jgi:hypothetical protein
VFVGIKESSGIHGFYIVLGLEISYLLSVPPWKKYNPEFYKKKYQCMWAFIFSIIS